MFKKHDILGTDKPIFIEKGLNHFFLDEISHLNENPEDYKITGYVQLIKNREVFFRPVYSK